MILKSRNRDEKEVSLQEFVNVREFGDNITILSVLPQALKYSFQKRKIPVATCLQLFFQSFSNLLWGGGLVMALWKGSVHFSVFLSRALVNCFVTHGEF